jgi:hypothetical protein
MIKAALRGLEISAGFLSPALAAYNAYDSANVGQNTLAVAVTPTVMVESYKALTVNGAPARSGGACQANLAMGNNRFSIAVTASDGAARTCTLHVQRGAR